MLTCSSTAKRLQKLESQINSLAADGAKGFRSLYEGIKDGNSELPFAIQPDVLFGLSRFVSLTQGLWFH